jgi:hypothetical protein
MAKTKADFDALFAQVDAETTRIATRVLELLEQIKGGGLTEADEEAAFASATVQLEKLKAIAADPENPVPDEEPTPTDPNA